jgi:outer membrane immunogenic protein
MRCLLVALGLIASISGAFAQEFELPTLRGSDYPVAPRWNGFYVGGQIGYGQAHFDFSPVGAAFGTRDVSASNYGAFIGYNTQWEGVVLGIEANYSHTSLAGSSTWSSNGSVGTNLLEIPNYGTLRARAGFILYDCILPYAMIGAAAGYANMTSTQTNSFVPPPITTVNQGGHVIWGFSVGAGVDVALSPSVFVRAEYEYVQFAFNWITAGNPNPNLVGCLGSSCIVPTINAVRAAIGFRF